MNSSDYLEYNSFEILIEYERRESNEYDDKSKQYKKNTFLYISFESELIARAFFSATDLDPSFADIENNRIIIKPATSYNPYGVHDNNFRNVYIELPEILAAEKFCHAILKSGSMPEVRVQEDTRVCFPNLIHPDYSLEKRIKADLSIAKHLVFYFFVLKNIKFTDMDSSLPNESFRYISMSILRQLVNFLDPLHFSKEYRLRQRRLTKKFGLPKLSADLKGKIIADGRIKISKIKYTTVFAYGLENIHQLHFTGETVRDTHLFSLRLENAGHQCFYENQNTNEITLSSGLATLTDQKTRARIFRVSFGSANNLDQFLDSVDFAIPGVMRDERNCALYFSESYLINKTKTESLIKNVHQFIDEKIIKNLNEGMKTTWDSFSGSFSRSLNGVYSFWCSELEMNERIAMQSKGDGMINTKVNFLVKLKTDISQGLLDEIPLIEILSNFRNQYEYILSLDREGLEGKDTTTIKLLDELEKQFCGIEEKKFESSSFRPR